MASSSSQSLVNINNTTSTPAVEENPCWYLPLYAATIKGDWKAAKKIFDDNEGAITSKVAGNKTALHIAVATAKEIHFVKNLVELMPLESLAEKDDFGTALCTAATVGNIEAAKLLLAHNINLAYMFDVKNRIPLITAAKNGHKDMLQYLLDVTRDDVEPFPFAGESGALLLSHVINAEFYDVALDLVQRYPKISTVVTLRNPLRVLAGKPSAFPSGSYLNFLQRILYSIIFVELEKFPKHPKAGDIESTTDSSQVYMPVCRWLRYFRGIYSNPVCRKLQGTLWKVIEALVPHIKHIRDTKLMHHQVLELLKCMCKGAANMDDYSKANVIFKTSALLAAINGIHEIVEECRNFFPNSIWCLDEFDRNVISQAVMYRQENVYNLIYRMGKYKQYLAMARDRFRNNLSHLAGNLAPTHRLNLVSGAALQMQRELQWFKEVEKFVQPAYRNAKNSEGKTARMLFTEGHKDLVIEAEKWMKGTANSCTVAAALIVTVVFAAAITVPGGNNGGSGLPIFSREKAFIIFAISDALSLFSSTASLLMFLSILTSRYAEADFLYSLPKRLIIGLVTLFLSIATMMGAFSATLYIVFGHKNPWILSLVAAAACIPVTLFASLIFPLLMEMISSTYGPGIFGKQSECRFY